MIDYPALRLDVPRWRDAVRLEAEEHLYGHLPKLSQPRLSIEQETEAWQIWTASLDFGIDVQVLFVPPSAGGVVFAGPNFDGNHSLLDDPRVPLSRSWLWEGRTAEGGNLATNADRNRLPDAYPIARLRRSGHGLMTFHLADVTPDNPSLARPILSRFHPNLGCIGLWAWALASVAAGFAQAGRLAYVGHSRLGKAALCAAAMYGGCEWLVSIQSGTGGAAPFRKTIGETVEELTRVFPHWFCPALSHRLPPFDQHAILALCAPARVLLLGAREDTWADPEGQLQMLRLAEPAWPAGSRNTCHTRGGDHRVTSEDWDAVLEFVGEP